MRVWTQVGLPLSAPVVLVNKWVQNSSDPEEHNGLDRAEDNRDRNSAHEYEGINHVNDAFRIKSYEPPANLIKIFLRKVCPVLPGQDQNEIEQHILWQTTTMNLIVEKKAILSAWKDEKAALSGEGVDDVDENGDDIGGLESNNESLDGSHQRVTAAVNALSKEAERAAVKERLQR